ncbi:helix-turn-helix transcriptional regulator [Pseudoalteromonas sp. OOF1S-7]|uniref:helix-turn-helix domain-containing protein n=1 Tax=Pseudoalteromonas sp. OOF1S-7 TaxID=2917757 RepID=UPI001EF54E59|nr:helix-turn-helix transcriptional regulator [Pseudoalteromonas sp. OOF1S-7]MCG7535978.1 helix-turn-helix transcriptional regulator [Pseudoalteromonas sp. OOF1S-7]
MEFSRYFLFFFASLGAFNGLLLTAWIYHKRQELAGAPWLSLLLLMLSVRIGKSVAFYFSPELSKDILQLGLSACCLIGPSLFSFCFRAINPEKYRVLLRWHFAAWVSAVLLLGGLYPYHSHLELWQNWIYRGSSYVWLGYLLAASWLYRGKLVALWSTPSRLTWRDMPLVVLGGGWLIWLAYYTAAYTSYIMGALSFSMVLYLSIVVYSGADRTTVKYAAQRISVQQSRELSAKLAQLLDEEQLFTDPGMSLPRLARRLGVSHTKLSQFLNQHYGCNFNQYLNRYRVEYAQVLLCQQQSLTIDHVAELCGFNASSTFYTAFKKYSGQTPSQFRAKNTPELSS